MNARKVDDENSTSFWDDFDVTLPAEAHDRFEL